MRFVPPGPRQQCACLALAGPHAPWQCARIAAQPSAAHGDADHNEGRDSEQSLRATRAVLLRGRWPGGWILLVLAVWGAIAVTTIADRF